VGNASWWNLGLDLEMQAAHPHQTLQGVSPPGINSTPNDEMAGRSEIPAILPETPPTSPEDTLKAVQY